MLGMRCLHAVFAGTDNIKHHQWMADLFTDVFDDVTCTQDSLTG